MIILIGAAIHFQREQQTLHNLSLRPHPHSLPPTHTGHTEIVTINTLNLHFGRILPAAILNVVAAALFHFHTLMAARFFFRIV